MGKHEEPLASGVIVVLGLLFTGLHLWHGIDEITETLGAVLYGVLIPLGVSLGILVAGTRLRHWDWTGVSPWRLVGWCFGGIGIGLVMSGLLVGYQAAEGIHLSDVLFVHAMFGTYGMAFGFWVGVYDVQNKREQYAQQQETERLDEFANLVSHDLRNPLSVAEGRLELAMQECESDHLTDVHDAHDRIDALISDILTLAREGESATSLESVDLADLVESCWANVDRDSATLVADVECWVRADPSQLRQILENLFRNSVDHGGPDVTVTVGELSDGFYVEDDGPGIPPGEREDIFAMGYSTASEGTGFGLSIVEQLVDAHGWEIRVTEGGEGGARFEITSVTIDD